MGWETGRGSRLREDPTTTSPVEGAPDRIAGWMLRGGTLLRGSGSLLRKTPEVYERDQGCLPEYRRVGSEPEFTRAMAGGGGYLCSVEKAAESEGKVCEILREYPWEMVIELMYIV